MDQQVTKSPLESIIECAEKYENFLLQGGAGSGKTETLKQAVQSLVDIDPNKKIVCITHTNKAADEITDRIGSAHTVSTIHSFLNSQILPFRKNIHQVLPQVFQLPPFEQIPFEDGMDEKEYKKEERSRYKKSYEKLQDKSKQYFDNSLPKVVGKRDYDQDPDTFNTMLNQEIERFNEAVSKEIGEKNYKDVGYNETPYDSFRNITYGHDGLLKISALLFEKFDNFGRLISHKYDCIFIDEYQDTDEEVLRSFLTRMPNGSQLIVGLFGDSEQSIYEDGVGSAQEFVKSGHLTLIEKEDNFRCSPQVIKLANQFRSDGLEQKVALKQIDGNFESLADREGSAKLYYCIKPPQNEGEENADYATRCEAMRDQIIDYAATQLDNPIKLKLPNRSVAADAGFAQLYKIFNNRFAQPREEIKKHLDRMQFSQLFDLLHLFEASKQDKRAFNRLLSKLKTQGHVIAKRADKEAISTKINEILNSADGAYQTLCSAIEYGLIKKSDPHERYVDRKNVELERISDDPTMVKFCELYIDGHNTAPRLEAHLQHNPTEHIDAQVVREKFNEWKGDFQKKEFYEALFSDDLKFSEIISFYRYEDDDSNFMTMHKTKGTGLENVIVVLDEYNWRAYDFGSCFTESDSNPKRQNSSKKLLYVACSRTKKNLAVVRLAQSQEEVDRMIKFFEDSEEVQLESADQT